MIHYVVICSILVLKSLGPGWTCHLPLSGIVLGWIFWADRSRPSRLHDPDGWGWGSSLHSPLTWLSPCWMQGFWMFLGEPQVIFANHSSNWFIFSQLTNLSIFLYFQALFTTMIVEILLCQKATGMGVAFALLYIIVISILRTLPSS